jgi:hypothetical protein
MMIDVVPFGPQLGIDDVRAAYELDGSVDGPAALLILELQSHMARVPEKASRTVRLMRDVHQAEIRHVLSYRRLPGFIDFRGCVRTRDSYFDRLRSIEQEMGDLVARDGQVKDLMHEYKRTRRALDTAFQPGWHYAVLLSDLRAARERLDEDPIPEEPEVVLRDAPEERLPAPWEIRADIVRRQVGLLMPWEMTSIVHYGELMDRVTRDVLHGVSGMNEDLLRRLFRNEIEERGKIIRGMVPEHLILHVLARISGSCEGLEAGEIAALSRRIKEREAQFRSDDIIQNMADTLRLSGQLAN